MKYLTLIERTGLNILEMSTKITKYTCITLFPLLSTISYPRPINVLTYYTIIVHAIRNTVLANGFCLYS